MTKYNLHDIMTNAWGLFRKIRGKFGDCLRAAWAEAKTMIAQAQIENGGLHACLACPSAVSQSTAKAVHIQCSILGTEKQAPKNVVISTYDAFNFRRYGDPWVALVDSNGRINFKPHVGCYTGARGKGEAGELYVYAPVEGQVYAYGQKDYRGRNGGYGYVQFVGGKFVNVEKEKLIEALNGGF